MKRRFCYEGKKIIAGVFASALFVSAALSVSAAKESKTISRDMSKYFSKTTNNGVGYMYYHVGSVRPYDDVFAYSETKVTSGMDGYAGVSITGTNNVPSAQYSDKIINGSYIRTDNAVVSSCDVAKRVNFTGARRQANTDQYTGFNYNIN